MKKATHMIRLTGVLIVDEKVLLIEQNIRDRKWYLPGGTLEKDETMEAGIIREMWEETGAEVEVERMVCIADTDFKDPAALHVLFQLKLCGGKVGIQADNHDRVPITDVRFVPISALKEYGFSESFMDACRTGFTNVPAYIGRDTFFDLMCMEKIKC